jgi:hypothetical protein
VGLGSAETAHNPFATANLPTLERLLGANWFVKGNGTIIGTEASMVPTDANLGIEGRPQSASGQATILTGRNVSEQIGGHFGPWPSKAIYENLSGGTIFDSVLAAGGRATYLNPFPQGYFDAIERGKRSYSAIPYAALQAGLPLMTEQDLRNGHAVSPGFTNIGWRTQLGISDMPLMTPEEAGERLAQVAQAHNFAFLEHWPTDYAGHRGPLINAVTNLELIDAVLAGLVDAWDMENGLLVITSDHGNIEEKQHGKHTRNPVPTILLGAGHAESAESIRDLTDIAPLITRYLGIN